MTPSVQLKVIIDSVMTSTIRSCDSLAQDAQTVFEVMNDIQEALDALRNPEGTADAPARTCKDLALAHPDLESGE